MHVNPKDNPRLVALVKTCINFLITCKLLLFKWLYDATIFLATNTNEKVCGWIVKSLLGVGWVYRDGSDYVYLTRFWANPGDYHQSYCFRLTLVMIAQRVLFGALRFSWLMKYIRSVQSVKQDEITLEFLVDNAKDLSWARMRMTIYNNDTVTLHFNPVSSTRPEFSITYPVEFNVLSFPAGFVIPSQKPEPATIDLTELENSANPKRWKILDKNQDESIADESSDDTSEVDDSSNDDEHRQRLVDAVDA
jgi:hypothetical protein